MGLRDSSWLGPSALVSGYREAEKGLGESRVPTLQKAVDGQLPTGRSQAILRSGIRGWEL